MLYYFIKQQVKARGLVWVSEDTEDPGTPFLRAFLPKGPCWTSPLQHPRLIWSHTLLLAAPGTVPSSQPGRLQPGKSRSSMSWRLGSRFPGRSMFLCCHLALVQSINSQCLGEALAEPSLPLRMPSENQRLVQQGHLKTAIYNLSSFVFFPPSLPLFFVFTFLGSDNTNYDTKSGFMYNITGAFSHGNFCLSMTYRFLFCLLLVKLNSRRDHNHEIHLLLRKHHYLSVTQKFCRCTNTFHINIL